MHLIDADASIKEIKERNPNDVSYEDAWAITCIEHAPTIKQPDLTHIIFATLAECGIYGEEATIKLIGTLKRLGRNYLLPPCVR